MKLTTKIIVGTSLSLAVSVALATEALTVTLGNPSDPSLLSNGVISFTVTNTGDVPIRFLPNNTPLAVTDPGYEDFVPANIFNVAWNEPQEPPGQSLRPLHAIHYTFTKPTLSSYIRLVPGQSVTKDVDLNTAFYFYSGYDFTVTYNLPFLEVMSDDEATTDPNLEGDGRAVSVTTAPFTFTYIRSSSSSMRMLTMRRQARATDSEGSVCTGDTRLTQPLADASAYADSALGSFYDFIPAAHNILDTSSPAYAKYTTWFGPWDPNYPHLPTSANEYSSSADYRVFSMAQALSSQFNISNRSSLNFVCGGCPATTINGSSTVAETDEAENAVRLCDAFFNLPKTGLDSQPSTLYHERSHFNTAISVNFGGLVSSISVPAFGDYFYRNSPTKRPDWQAFRKVNSETIENYAATMWLYYQTR